jgi:hypothetical protein
MRIVAVYIQASGHVVAGYVENEPVGSSQPTVESVVGAELRLSVVLADGTASTVTYAAAELAVATSADENLASEPMTALLVNVTGGVPTLARATPLTDGAISADTSSGKLEVTIDSPPSAPISGLRLRTPGSTASVAILPIAGVADLGQVDGGLLLVPGYPVISVGDLWPSESDAIG